MHAQIFTFVPSIKKYLQVTIWTVLGRSVTGQVPSAFKYYLLA